MNTTKNLIEAIKALSSDRADLDHSISVEPNLERALQDFIREYLKSEAGRAWFSDVIKKTISPGQVLR